MLSLGMMTVAQLAAAADRAVSDALDGTVTGWKATAPLNEPDAVAAMVSAGLPAAAVAWRALLKPLGYQVAMIGIFTHQTPKVSYVGGATSCELADLLVVIDEISGGATDRRALLIQAKIAHHPTLTLHKPNDLVQFGLLDTWPDFQFIHQPYPTNMRQIGAPGAPGLVGDSADYGLIDLLPSGVAWRQVDPANPMTPAAGVSFGELLADMAVGAAGRAAIRGGSDDWSDTVEELLRTTYFALAGGGFGGHPRGVTTFSRLSVNDDFAANGFQPAGVVHIFGGPPSAGEGGGEDAPRDPGPISVVHVRLTRAEESAPSGRG